MKNISEKLKRLRDKRVNFINASKKCKFNFQNILSDHYSNPGHFIFELLQNSEDAGASDVKIEIFEDRLDYYHNGREFSFEDIEGVTGWGNSIKKENVDSIGKFGIGFKSVFNITEIPYIYSGDFNVKIVEYIVPEEIKLDKNINKIFKDQTLIRIPFKKDGNYVGLILKELKEIELNNFLFLKNINKIEWSYQGEKFFFEKQIKNKKGFNWVKIFSADKEENFLVFNKNIKEINRDISLAYKININNGQIIFEKVENSRLFVYFPLEKRTDLNFIIHGPYDLPSNRENIKKDNDYNKKIDNYISELVTESMSLIKDAGILNLGFLNILPIEYLGIGNNNIYSNIYNAVKSKIISSDFLPTKSKEYSNKDNIAIYQNEDLERLLSNEDLNNLFLKKYWMPTEINESNMRNLRNYLINEIGVKDIKFNDFIENLNNDFLNKKNDSWMIEFYVALLNKNDLWKYRFNNIELDKSIKNKNIIRISDNSHIAPFDESGALQVYLPAKNGSNYKTVKNVFIEDKKCLEFFKKMGLKEPSLLSEIKEFIFPKYKKEILELPDDYFQDIEKLFSFYQKKDKYSYNDTSFFKDEIKKISFIYSRKNNCDDFKFLKPSDVYIKNEDLVNYFLDYSIYFVDDEVFRNIKDKNLFEKFLMDIGVNKLPKIEKKESNLSENKKKEIRKNYWKGPDFTKEIEVVEPVIAGFNNFFCDLDNKKSFLFWEILLKLFENWNNKDNFLKGKYIWFFRDTRTEYFDSDLLNKLKKEKWLIDKNGNFRSPFELNVKDLDNNYCKEYEYKKLAMILGFKTDLEDELEKQGKKIVNIEDFYEIQEYKKNKEREGKNELSELNNNNIEKKEINVIPNKYVYDSNISINKVNNESGGKGTLFRSNIKNISSIGGMGRLKAGGSGEKIVFDYLCDKFGAENVEWVSSIAKSNGYNNYGSDNEYPYDISYKNNGLKIYCEVKSTSNEFMNFFEISKREKDFGEKNINNYEIYLVINSNSDSPTISGPFSINESGFDIEVSSYNFRFILKK